MSRTWAFRDGVAIMGLVALALLATGSIWRDILSTGLRSAEQSHILLAPFIAAWLVWVRRERLRHCRPARSFAGPAMVAAGWLIQWGGFRTSVLIAEHFGALMVVIGAATTIMGTRPLKLFAPAAAALLFLFPVPGTIRQEIAIPLQQASAAITHFFLDLLGTPATRAGNVLSINGHDVAVAEACNGMRMVSSLGLVAFAFVFSVPMRNWVRVALLALTPPLALLCNVLRLIPTVLLFGYADTSLAEVFHDVSGWLMLLIALGLLWLPLGLLQWLEVPVRPFGLMEKVAT